MKSLTMPLGSVCALFYMSTALAAEPSGRTQVAAVDPTTTGEGSDASVDTAQSPSAPATSKGREAKNALYLDLGGPGLLYSINYDRMLTEDLSARIGFSYLSYGVSAGAGDANASAEFSYFAIPLTASYLGIGSESNMLELGGGPVIVNFSGSGILEAEEQSAEVDASYTMLALTGMVGYRHQPADGGFVFRIGASPMKVFGVSYIIPEGYLSLGAAF
jgi:hypothetical protein